VVAAKEEKLGKHFSLFSVVTFGNEECTSDTSISGGATQGTCYSSTECSDKNGMSSGNCASGFGVCCVFLNTAAAASNSITENRTRVRNSEYPSYATATAATTVAYTVNKMSSDICQIRLDFGAFIIAGPSVTNENIPASSATNYGTVCQDSLTLLTTEITSRLNSPFGTICGSMTGEHLYVDLSPTASDTLTATIVTATAPTPAIAQRVWDIKFSQLECHATYRAPDGCQRYFMENTGKITSINFNLVTGATRAAAAQNTGLETQMQNHRNCVRRAKNMCCVEYQLCSMYNGKELVDVVGDTSNAAGGYGIWHEAWSLDLNTSPWVVQSTKKGASTNVGLTDAMCTGDYVDIPSSMGRACGSNFGSHLSAMNTRYCGTKFGANYPAGSDESQSMPVCDCSEPWSVTIHTDDFNDIGTQAAATTGLGTSSFNRGVCLEFKQTPCHS